MNHRNPDRRFGASALGALMLAAAVSSSGAGALAQGIGGDRPLPDLSDQLIPPMPVTIQINQFRILDADEDGGLSNGDEPYLLLAAVFADGTTISVANRAEAKVRILSPSKTHGNLGLDGVDKGTYVSPSPGGLGRIKTTIRPIGGLKPLSLAKNATLVGFIVIAMEEDGTPTSAMNKAREAFRDALEKEINKAVRDMQMPDMQQTAARVQKAMIAAIQDDLLSSPGGFFAGLPGLADPDDFIGVGYSVATYAQIENAGAAGIPFDMTFKQSGVRYRISGSIRTP